MTTPDLFAIKTIEFFFPFEGWNECLFFRLLLNFLVFLTHDRIIRLRGFLRQEIARHNRTGEIRHPTKTGVDGKRRRQKKEKKKHRNSPCNVDYLISKCIYHNARWIAAIIRTYTWIIDRVDSTKLFIIYKLPTAYNIIPAWRDIFFFNIAHKKSR